MIWNDPSNVSAFAWFKDVNTPRMKIQRERKILNAFIYITRQAIPEARYV